MKKALLVSVALLILLLGLSITAAASAEYYETVKADVPIWSSYSSDSNRITTISSAEYVLQLQDYVINSSGNKWFKIGSSSYGGRSLSGCWVYSGNVTGHSHDCTGNGGRCKYSGCDYVYGYSITGMDALYEGNVSGGAKTWTMPYSTGGSVNVGTIGYQSVVRVTGKAKNADGNEWFRLSSGYWVYSGNVTPHYHDYAGNGGVCKLCGNVFSYSVSSMSGLYQGDVSGGANIWTMPYSTGQSSIAATLGYQNVVSVTGKTTNADGNVWYRLSSGYWIYSGNVTPHSHDCTGNGGVCKYPGCGYTYSYSVSSMSGLYQGDVSGGANIWTLPYSTGQSSIAGTIGYQNVVSVNGKTTNADGNVWYRLSSGYWVYSGNVRAHTHDCAGNGGACKNPGCTYTYPLSISSFSATFVATNADGTAIWSLPYSTGKSAKKRVAAYGEVLSVTGKATNAEDHVWYQLSDGSWVWPSNVTRRYTVTYDANGGKNPPSAQHRLANTCINITSKKPSRVGYIFKTWNTKSDGSGVQYNPGSSYEKDANTTLYAIWSKCSSHNYDGGICTKCAYEYPLTIDSLSNLTYAVINDGTSIWSRPYSSNSTTVRKESKGKILTVNGKTTNEPGNLWYRLTDGNWVYSENVKRSYKINYVLNGGTNNSANPQYYYDGQKVTIKKPSRAGYTFAGWYLDSSLTKVISEITTKGSITVYAKWTPNKYTIVFSGNGGSGSVGSQSATYDKAITLNANAFTRTWYTFAGWNTKSDGSGKSFANQASVKNLSATDGATVTLYAQWNPNDPVITSQPVTRSAEPGTAVTMSVKASGIGLTYQWQYKSKSASSWTSSSVSSSRTPNWVITVSEDHYGLDYRCAVRDDYGKTIYTKTVRIDQPATIITQPASKSAAVGESATLSVKAAGTGLTYQWQYKSKSASSWTSSTFSSAKTANWKITVSEAHYGLDFRCVVKDSYGKTVYTKKANINPPAPSIKTQPSSRSAAVGASATLSVKASGTGLTYQWQYKSKSASSWTSSTFSSAKTANWKIAVSKAHYGLDFRCAVKDSYGRTVYTKTVQIDQPATITTQPASKTAAVGAAVTLSVKAAGKGLTYQWQYKKKADSSWTSSTFSSAKTANWKITVSETHYGLDFRCVVKDSYGKTVYTKKVNINKPGPSIKTQPSSRKAAVGTAVTLSVKASGSGLTYQWQYRKKGESSWTSSTFSSAKTANWKITVSETHYGLEFRCVVKDSSGKKVYTKTVNITRP